jgi:hypothetical protein
MRRHPVSTLLLLLAAVVATPGCATMYANKTLSFTRERPFDVVAVNRAAVDRDHLFVDLVVRAVDRVGTQQVTLDLPLSSLTGELRLREPARDGLLHSWTRIDERTRVARASGRALRRAGGFPERAVPLPLRREGLDEFSAATLPLPTGGQLTVSVVTTTSPPSTLLAVVLPRPAWIDAERLLISGVDVEQPRAESYAAWAGAVVVDVVLWDIALQTIFCALGGCY